MRCAPFLLYLRRPPCVLVPRRRRASGRSSQGYCEVSNQLRRDQLRADIPVGVSLRFKNRVDRSGRRCGSGRVIFVQGGARALAEELDERFERIGEGATRTGGSLSECGGMEERRACTRRGVD